MAAYQCLNCCQIERSDEDCCDKPDLFCINDMPGEILRLRGQVEGMRAMTREEMTRRQAEAVQWARNAGMTHGGAQMTASPWTSDRLMQRLEKVLAPPKPALWDRIKLWLRGRSKT